MPLFALGYDNFEELCRSGRRFVDKSGMIEVFVDDPAKVVLVPRPRRFGKSLNLSMLRSFFDCRRDSQDCFDGLAVMDAPRHVLEQMGQYPVIELSLKSVKAQDFNEAKRKLAKLVSQLVRSFPELADSGRLLPAEKDLWALLAANQASEEDVAVALVDLSQMLCKHWGRKVVLLLDEYDAPISHAYLMGYDAQMIDYMRT